MPTVRDQPPQKKRKFESSSKQTYRYTSSEDIRRLFKAQSEGILADGLTALRNQLTVKANEPPVQINDERLTLAKEWLEADPGAQELFAVWESANARQASLLAVIVGVLSALVTLLSSHYTHHAYAQPIIRTLLSQQWTHSLNLYISGQHTELVLVTLKLLNSLTNFAGGRERKAVLEAVAWESKSLPKLLHMRRKAKGGDDVDMLARPDIRTLYMLLVLSFVEATTPSPIKATFLEQHRDAFTSIFKGLSQDPYPVVRRVLEVCWSGLWADAKLKRTLKIQLFNEATLSHLIKLYERNVPEDSDQESVPADVVHHFLLALCSHPGVGLCFHDRGWYPRETDDDQRTTADDTEYGRLDGAPSKGSKVYNKILANVLKTLKVNEDPRQQELTLKILGSCPELIASYWSGAGLALEPRLSSKWLANIAFFGAVVSLPVPVASFVLPQSGSGSSSLYQPSPPPLAAIVDNIIPTAHIKTHLSRGLQATSPLVQHASALALAKCLLKYEQVVSAFREVERALEEDEEDGLWAKRRRDIEREVRRRVPEFQVIVGFSQRLNETSGDKEGKNKEKEMAPNPTRTALLTESAHRLLWLYHRLLPSVVAEARFDAGKLLQAIEDMLSQGATGGLDTLRQLHVLRLLKESEHFTWSSKSGSKHSNLHILLKAYIVTPFPAVRTALVALLRHILAPGVLFQHDADEIALWLAALPQTRRAPGARSPDGVPLMDEGDGVIAFLDDCVQRCVKTPYKYVEELQAVHSSGTGADNEASNIGTNPEAFPSPLLATLVEQLGAKLKGRLLTASDALALVAFSRKLVVRLASKSADLKLLQAIVNKLVASVEEYLPSVEGQTIRAGIRREAALLLSALELLQSPAKSMAQKSTAAVSEFLAQVESIPEPDSQDARQVAAYELVDWIRLIGPPLRSADLSRLMTSVERFYPPALQELYQYLDPRQVSLFEGASTPSHRIPFEVLLSHCTDDVLEQEPCRKLMVKSIFDQADEVDIKHAIQLLLHRLRHPTIADQAVRDGVHLLACIIDRTRAVPSINSSNVVLFCLNSDVFKSISTRSLPGKIREGFDELLQTCFNEPEDVRQLFAGFTGHWVLLLRDPLDNLSEDQCATALMWFKYLNAEDSLSLLSYLVERAEHSSAAASQEILGDVLTATASTLSQNLDATTQALPLLCRLQSHLPGSSDLEKLITAGTAGSLPLAHDGYLPIRSFSDWNIASLIPDAGRRWSLRNQPVPSLSLASILQREPLSDAGADIVTHLLYRQGTARLAVAEWLASPVSANCSIDHIVQVLYAFYDTASEDYPELAVEAHFSRVLKVVMEYADTAQARSMAATCVTAMVVSSPSNRAKYLKTLSKELSSVAPQKLNIHCLSVAQDLVKKLGSEADVLAEQVLDVGLKWVVRYIADGNTTSGDGAAMLSVIASLIKAGVAAKSHLVEPVMVVVTQDGLKHSEGLRFARLLASSTHLKPASVNKFLQTVVQHTKLYEYCSTSVEEPSLRNDIASFLHTLFHLHPTNTCQPSHVEPLKRIYGGTLGIADLKILSIFQLFETTRKTSVASLLSGWSTSTDITSENPLEAIQSLEPSRVLKTCLEYPDWRKLVEEDKDEHDFSRSNDQLYDPAFVLLLFAQMLSESGPSSALAWVQLFRSNVVSLILRTLSVKDDVVREIAWAQIAALYRLVEDADMQEKPHVLHILNLLKDLLPSAPSDIPRLPTYTTLLLAHAFRALFYPSNFIYPLTARFLLQRPALDASDVPLLFGMLYSAADEWKKERAWIVRFLADGMAGSEEWRVLRRRHTWDLLASLFQAEDRDRALRRGVLEVLANITCNARATASLLLRHAMLAWIEMQLCTLRVEEAIAWVRIIENILTVVDARKVEAATNGDWRAAAGRCLKSILEYPGCTQDVFVAAIPVLLRLALLPGPLVSHIPGLLKRSMHWLPSLEADIALPTSNVLPVTFEPDLITPASSLHRSQHLFDAPPAPTPELWGACVEALWRVSMTLPGKTEEWDALSQRLLIWRSIAGAERTPVGEWARREVVGSLLGDGR